MPQNPPEGYPAVMPYLHYEDASAALDFLSSAFGFKEKFRMQGEDGKVVHAEVEIGAQGVVMLGEPGGSYENPKNVGGKQRAGSVYVYVDDVDSHYARLKDIGATMVAELEDKFYGDRSYGVEDLEGHHWYFATHVRDVPSEEIDAAMAQASGATA